MFLILPDALKVQDKPKHDENSTKNSEVLRQISHLPTLSKIIKYKNCDIPSLDILVCFTRVLLGLEQLMPMKKQISQAHLTISMCFSPQWILQRQKIISRNRRKKIHEISSLTCQRIYPQEEVSKGPQSISSLREWQYRVELYWPPETIVLSLGIYESLTTSLTGGPVTNNSLELYHYDSNSQCYAVKKCVTYYLSL